LAVLAVGTTVLAAGALLVARGRRARGSGDARGA